MPFNDLFAERQSNTCSGIFAAGVQALKDEEDAFKIFGFDADAIIVYIKLPGALNLFDANVDVERSYGPELDRVSN